MASVAVRAELPRWLSSSSVAWVGALLALMAILLTGGFLWYEQREVHRRELQSSELLARALEDHANRTFNTVDIALGTLAESVKGGPSTGKPDWLGPALVQTQQGLPFLRSLSLLDSQGRVLASSASENVGVMVDLARVPLPAPGAIDRLGSLVGGRDLAAVAQGAAAAAHTHSFIPITRLASGSNGAPLYLVAALNPDFFANEYPLMLADESRSAALFATNGVLLTATENISMAPGGAAIAHRFFKDFLPARESGSFIGPGIDGNPAVSALRTLRKRPVAVVVERNYANVHAEYAATSGAALAACGAALALIAIMVGLAWRSLRSHESVYDALESTRQRVAASEESLRTLVESVHEWIFRTDAQGRITFVNRRWSEISGRSDAAAIGHRLADLCMPADRERIEAQFKPDGADGNRPHQALTVQMQTPRAELLTLEVSVAPVRAADQTVMGFAGFAVDVSERQMARRRLESQFDFTARLLDVSPTPLFVKDVQGRFITVNRAWLDLMALTQEQTIGHDSADLFGGQAQYHFEQDERLLQSGDRISYENRLLRPDLEERDTVVTKVRFTHADGSPAGIVGSIIDVTEFREAERTTREARDAAERANSAKTAFIADISHELRTPLQAIIGFSDLGQHLSLNQPDFREMFNDIHAGGQRMLTLVNGLLDMAKMESTVDSLTLRRADVSALAGAVVHELRPLAAQRGLQLELLEPFPPLPADVDAFRIQQVIRNVLANALRFAPSGSRIEIIGRDRGEMGTELEVRDHGPGIPVDELETIFDAFVQSSRTRDGSGGTGLGLTICRKIMSAHGGSICAANAVTGGAQFLIRLPPSAQTEAVAACADIPLEVSPATEQPALSEDPSSLAA